MRGTSHEKSDYGTNSSHPSSPCIGQCLLRRWQHVDKQGTVHSHCSIDCEIHQVDGDDSEDDCQSVILSYFQTRNGGLCKERLAAVLSQPVKTAATPLVKPRSNIATTQMPVPSNIYGLLLPNREVELSAKAPISGCTTSPESGPATNTAAIEDFERPNDKR